VTSLNEQTYAAPGIVRYYEQIKALQPAEQIILDWVVPQLGGWSMLDIGVGAGRTTRYFGPLAAQYIGIDSSAVMISACQRTFPETPQCRFAVVDARDMGCFADDAFDFVLFSFNGIDYVDDADRLGILNEIYRVCKPGALFCFSSHNLQGFEQAFSLKSQWSWNPLTTYANWIMLGILRLLNRPLTLAKLQHMPFAIVRDESHNFGLKTYYIRPTAQIAQLEEQFEAIRVYSWKGGEALETGADGLLPFDHQAANTDLWLYYCCTAKAPMAG
jgi:ubiquinone/menaquinone biosynthesis C-methylase UbiE